jgi:serine/threonine protein kinase
MATRPSPASSQPTEPIGPVDPTLRKHERSRDPTETAQIEDGDGVRVEDRRERRHRAVHAGGPVVLDRYRLHRRLGSGAFGTVWLARDERLERDVAVKLLPRERIVGGRFEREARAAARLSHPGIVTLYEAAVDDDGAYLVSELVRGATLGALLEAGRLSDRDIVQIGVALCDALAHAHAEGVVHRDVKPSNVLIPERPATPTQIAKLTDFGVARIIGGGDRLTRTGDVIGTEAYMAPEQAEGLEAGATADLYSLALVIYESLTGLNPVDAGTAARRARRLGAYLPAVRRQRRDLPRELGCAIDLALRPRPRERGSVEELRDALLGSLAAVQDRPGVVTSPWPARQASGDGIWTRHDERLGQKGQAAHDPGVWPGDDESRLEASAFPRIGWPDRVLGGATAAGIAAWLAAVVLVPSALNPAVAAVVAGLVVMALPRIGWVALTAAAGATLAAQGRPGATLVVVIAGLIPPLLLLRRAGAWPLGAIAPALGAIGLAGAWPALAGRVASAWQRAALGATGWILLIAAQALGHVNLYLRLPRHLAPPSVWMPSLQATGQHLLAPLVSSAVLAPALVWALAAVVLPWVTVMRSLPVKVVLVTIWTAATASATTTVLHASHSGAVVKADAAVLGAVGAALVALVPPIAGSLDRRQRPRGQRTDNSAAGLA